MITAFKGPIAYYSGIGKFFTGLAQRLGKKIELEILPLDNVVPDPCPVNVTSHPRATQFGVIIGHPHQLNQLPTRYRVMYTMYEESDLPHDWKVDVPRPDELWVPSTFCKEVFGAYRPDVRIVPIGFDESTFYPDDGSGADRFRALLLPDAKDKRVIGTAGVMSKRKGIDVLVKAFELAALDDTILVIKTRDTRGDLPPLPDNVQVFDEDWSDELMADYYRALDLFVFPSRGEGAGLPPLEAAACGTPALATRASGLLEFIDDRGIYGIEVSGLSRAVGVLADNAMWYEPDIDDLVDKLRSFCYHPPKVEHRYRQHSMDAITDCWEREVMAARERASHGGGQ